MKPQHHGNKMKFQAATAREGDWVGDLNHFPRGSEDWGVSAGDGLVAFDPDRFVCCVPAANDGTRWFALINWTESLPPVGVQRL